MTNNKKAARAGTPTALNTALDSRNHTKFDPLIGCFNLANFSCQCSNQPNNQRGKIDTCLAGQLALLAVIVILFANEVMP